MRQCVSGRCGCSGQGCHSLPCKTHRRHFGCRSLAAGVLRVAFLSALSVTSQFHWHIHASDALHRTSTGLPAVRWLESALILLRRTSGAAYICLFARFVQVGASSIVPLSQVWRAYVILYIATGTLLPVLVIIMCPTGSNRYVPEHRHIPHCKLRILLLFRCRWPCRRAVLCFHDIAGAARLCLLLLFDVQFPLWYALSPCPLNTGRVILPQA